MLPLCPTSLSPSRYSYSWTSPRPATGLVPQFALPHDLDPVQPVVPYELLVLIMIIRGGRCGSEVSANVLFPEVLQAHEELAMPVVRIMPLKRLGKEVRNIGIRTYVTYGEETLITVVADAKPPDLEVLGAL